MRMYISLGIGMLLLMLVGCTQPAPPVVQQEVEVETVYPPSVPTENYADPEGGFAFAYPTEWTLSFGHEPDSTQLRIAKTGEPAILVILVNRKPSVRSFSIEELEIVGQEVVAGYTDATITPVLRDGKPLVRLRGTDPSDGTTPQRIGYLYSDANGMIAFILATSPERETQDAELLYTTVDSFRFLDTATDAPAPPAAPPADEVPVTFIFENAMEHDIRLKARVNGETIFNDDLLALEETGNQTTRDRKNVTFLVPNQYLILEVYEKVANVTDSGIVDPADGRYVMITLQNNSFVFDQRKNAEELAD